MEIRQLSRQKKKKKIIQIFRTVYTNITHLMIFLTCSRGISSFWVSTNPNFLLSLYRFEFSCCHFLAFSSSLASASAGEGNTVYEGCAAGGGGIEEPPVPGGAICPLFHILRRQDKTNLQTETKKLQTSDRFQR